jgi:hypothetical protein
MPRYISQETKRLYQQIFDTREERIIGDRSIPVARRTTILRAMNDLGMGLGDKTVERYIRYMELFGYITDESEAFGPGTWSLDREITMGGIRDSRTGIRIVEMEKW